MISILKRIFICSLVCLAAAQTVFAAAAPSGVQNIRFSQGAEAVRIVFDLDKAAQYKVEADEAGTKISIEFSGAVNKTKRSNLAIGDALVKGVTFAQVDKERFRAVIELSRKAAYEIHTLKNPDRVFIDITKKMDQKVVRDIQPGLRHITIMRSGGAGMLTVNVLDVDLQYGYRLRPVLADDKVLGRETLSSMAKRHNALGAVNASYFAPSGEILGLTKIDSKIVSSTYLARSAFGVAKDGKPLIGEVFYRGAVKFGKGTQLPVSGVNAQRGENGLILYNAYYDTSTKTNVYGKEYIIKDGHVIDIRQGDAPLAAGTVVISVHGASEAKLDEVQLGDPVTITEDLGKEWNDAAQILGVGPRLVKDNSIYLTTKAEQFGADVAGGRAPRTAVGITEDGHVLLVVVDGRQKHSIGCTLLELAILMQELGARDAVNFDGGGSSEMVVGGAMVNSPSDGGERRVGTSLVILPK